MAAAKPKPIRVKWVLDYTDHPAGQYVAACDSDREDLIAYSAIVKESAKGVVHTYIVEYEVDGWVARGQVEETEAQIGPHAEAERI